MEPQTFEQPQEKELTQEQQNIQKAQTEILEVLKKYEVQLIGSVQIIGNQIANHSVQIISQQKKETVITK